MTKSKSSLIFVCALHISQSAITCSKFTIETLEQGVKYVQSYFNKIIKWAGNTFQCPCYKYLSYSTLVFSPNFILKDILPI